MHRFRKKSDPRRAATLDPPYDPQVSQASRGTQQRQESLPPLPPASDFRTSLILPGLTRRFSVLRNSSGEPIGIDEIKSRFAEQRARGSENRVSEEEEDMILEALSRLRGKGTSTSSQPGPDDMTQSEREMSGYSDSQDGTSRLSTAPSVAGGQSVHSTTSSVLHGSPSIASLSSSKSQVSRRMSNNLFGSGKLHDHTYIRTAYQRRTGPGVTRSPSVKHADSNTSMSTITSSRIGQNNSTYSDAQSLRPVTPEGSMSASSAPSSPSYAYAKDSDVDSKNDLSSALLPEVLGRASLALDEVIRELEEEGDDQILMERSPISPTSLSSISHLSQSLPEPSPLASSAPTSPLDSEAGMAFSSDESIMADEAQRVSPFPRAPTTSPTPRLPGYIPGMPRPMTPHDPHFDPEDLTPSTTPRATSPRLPTIQHQPPISQTLTSGVYRSNSTASVPRSSRAMSPTVTPPISTSPMFFHRSTNGRFTPEDRSRNGSRTDSPSPIPDTVSTAGSGRHRPVSPLSGQVFQPLATLSGSRPTTPSNVTWNSSSSPSSSRGHARNGSTSVSGHSRNGSTASNTEGSGDTEYSRPNTRALRSPTRPESPWHDNRHASSTSLGINSEYRPGSAMSGTDTGSPAQALNNRPFRSPTPTHNATYSPTSANFADQGVHVNGNGISSSRRTSRQNGHSSFSLTPSHTLLFSPLGNSSRSSLESAGSSYHSWDEDHKKDRLFDLFTGLDPQPQWHDLSTNQSGASTSRTTPYDTENCENTVKRELGLNKSDIAAIQDKLVTTALTKAATPEGRHRANSVRRRRPSTSQSNYSYSGEKATTQAPQTQSSVVAPAASAATYTSRQVNSEQLAKANALLDSVVDSIQSPRNKPLSLVTDPVASPAKEPSITTPSPSQKHRALADALFGTEDRPPSDLIVQPGLATEGALQAPQLSESIVPTVVDSPTGQIDGSFVQSSSGGEEHTTGSANEPLSTGTDALEHVDPTLLALEVQRRAEAATAALRKSPSIQKLESSGSTRRRISPNQISSPTLVSASTSVDTIPLAAINTGQSRTPNPPSSSLLGGRLRRLRGTLRAKNPYPAGVENSRPSVELKTPPSVQSVTFPDASGDMFSKEQLATTSANETVRFKISPPPVSTPPASAGPGLKGFMSRFRKHKPTELPVSIEKHDPPSVSSGTLSSASTSIPEVSPVLPVIESQSAPASRSYFPNSSLSPQGPPSQSFTSPEPIPEDAAVPPSPPPQGDEAALQQLFGAARDLGLPEAALNDLLARSASTSSKVTGWNKVTRSNSVSGSRLSTRSDLRDRGASPLPYEGRSSVEVAPRPPAEIRQPSVRKNTEPLQAPRVPPANTDPSKAIVRRTIIISSDAKDVAALMRKQSTSRRRQSAGAASITSARSIQDRVPTPPPPRSNAGKRFSTGRSPPVPQLPHSLSIQADSLPPAQMEKSNSTYDSLYEMYAGDSRAPSAAYGEGSTSHPMQGDMGGETGTAVEVVELANGETIWSIVNGLRDDDVESVYDQRASFASEYSAEGVKVFFKEHARKSSKGSTTSLLSRKKQQTSASHRPETKVFFSSSAQIGRLIDNLTRDKEAGSFNIAPDRQLGHTGHSASSSAGSASDMPWTLEERLEHMLGSMSPNNP